MYALLVALVGVPLSESLSMPSDAAGSELHQAGLDPPTMVAWFHPPKTATSFAATVTHYANPGIPEEEGAKKLELWGPYFKAYPREQWFGDASWWPLCDHMPVSDEVYSKFKGHFVGLFRSPESRIISSWRHKAEGWGTALGYAERIEGTVVKELAGQEHGLAWANWAQYVRKDCAWKNPRHAVPAPEPDLALAQTRLSEGFKFVGLQSEFELSVCLFHTMFGGKCLPVEFENMRPTSLGGTQFDTEGNETTLLGDWKDRYDGPLFAAAEKIFWGNVKKYNVNQESCRQLCPEAAARGIFSSGGRRTQRLVED